MFRKNACSVKKLGGHFLLILSFALPWIQFSSPALASSSRMDAASGCILLLQGRWPELVADGLDVLGRRQLSKLIYASIEDKLESLEFIEELPDDFRLLLALDPGAKRTLGTMLNDDLKSGTDMMSQRGVFDAVEKAERILLDFSGSLTANISPPANPAELFNSAYLDGVFSDFQKFLPRAIISPGVSPAEDVERGILEDRKLLSLNRKDREAVYALKAIAESAALIERKDLVVIAVARLLQYRQFSAAAEVALKLSDSEMLFQIGVFSMAQYFKGHQDNERPFLNSHIDELHVAMSALSLVKGSLEPRAKGLLKTLGRAFLMTSDDDWQAVDESEMISVAALRLSQKVVFFDGEPLSEFVEPERIITQIEDEAVKGEISKRLLQFLRQRDPRFNAEVVNAVYAIQDPAIARFWANQYSKSKEVIDHFKVLNILGASGLQLEAFDFLTQHMLGKTIDSNFISEFYLALREASPFDERNISEIAREFFSVEQGKSLSKAKQGILKKIEAKFRSDLPLDQRYSDEFASRPRLKEPLVKKSSMADFIHWVVFANPTTPDLPLTSSLVLRDLGQGDWSSALVLARLSSESFHDLVVAAKVQLSARDRVKIVIIGALVP